MDQLHGCRHHLYIYLYKIWTEFLKSVYNSSNLFGLRIRIFSIVFQKIAFFSLAFFYFDSLGKVAIKMVMGTGPLDVKTKYQYPN